MASQIDNVREYTSSDESSSPLVAKCPLCQVKAVPRGITNTGTHDLGGQQTHCPNCGHTYNWNSLIDGRVQGVDVTGTLTITTDNGTTQLTANIAPYYADDKTVAWTSSNEAVATVDANGLVTAITNGTAVIRATSNADTGKWDEVTVTTSNQL